LPFAPTFPTRSVFVGRSAAYWAHNLYSDPRHEPKPSAPYRDLPPAIAARFRKLRQGLQDMKGVTEHIKYMGPSWGWAWESGIGHRKLCWVHVMDTGPAVTFTVADNEDAKVRKVARLPEAVAGAINEGQRTGPVRWCALEVSDQKTADAVL